MNDKAAPWLRLLLLGLLGRMMLVLASLLLAVVLPRWSLLLPGVVELPLLRMLLAAMAVVSAWVLLHRVAERQAGQPSARFRIPSVVTCRASALKLRRS